LLEAAPLPPLGGSIRLASVAQASAARLSAENKMAGERELDERREERRSMLFQCPAERITPQCGQSVPLWEQGPHSSRRTASTR
jgi:hypothetical protein